MPNLISTLHVNGMKIMGPKFAVKLSSCHLAKKGMNVSIPGGRGGNEVASSSRIELINFVAFSAIHSFSWLFSYYI